MTEGSTPAITDHDVPKGRLAWANWRATLWLALGLLAAKVLYLLLLCPYELAYDEAQYWVWSRHLAWSYYTKGPGVAWAIATSTGLFGDVMWAVRLPTAVAGSIAMLAVAKLANEAYGDQRVGFIAAVLYAMTPVYTAMHQFMTIDGPLLACWALGAWLGWRAYAAARDGRSTPLTWALFGIALGVGFLFKYTTLLLLPGVLLFLFLRRAELRGRWVWFGILVMFAVLVVMCCPVLIWNMQNDWAAVQHLLGHLGVGEEHASAAATESPSQSLDQQILGLFVRLVSYPLVQALILGLPLTAMILMALRRSIRTRDRTPDAWPGDLYCFICAAPVLVLYLMVAFVREVIPNWPVAAFVTVLVPVARHVVIELSHFRKLLDEWRALPKPRPKRGYLRRKPEIPWQIAWDWAVGWGIVALIGILFTPHLVRLVPVVNELENVQRGLERVTGQTQWINRVDQAREKIAADVDIEPILVADYYGQAAQLAFYLPDQPKVYCAGSLMGRRRNPYDFWPETNLADPALHGQSFLLVGRDAETWYVTLRFERIIRVDDQEPIFLGVGYAGLQRPAQTNQQ